MGFRSPESLNGSGLQHQELYSGVHQKSSGEKNGEGCSPLRTGPLIFTNTQEGVDGIAHLHLLFCGGKIIGAHTNDVDHPNWRSFLIFLLVFQ